ncbi:MAG: hypothetical protein JWO93_2912 [Micrococcaceae bacterium]|jgi:hypothetical protein|nr:hypothetical protein [Micrococcaceae bacterium]
MSSLPSFSSVRRVFFSPVDQNRVDQVREQHERIINELNIRNLR